MLCLGRNTSVLFFICFCLIVFCSLRVHEGCAAEGTSGRVVGVESGDTIVFESGKKLKYNFKVQGARA